MQPLVVMYLVYVTLSVGLTVWVGRTLFRSGRIFLVDVFAGNEKLADAVNHLLVVGFYLVNLGYVSLALRTTDAVGSPESAIETLSWKIGLVLLVLGGMHFFNMYVFARCRRRALIDNAPPPVVPDRILPPPPHPAQSSGDAPLIGITGA